MSKLEVRELTLGSTPTAVLLNGREQTIEEQHYVWMTIQQTSGGTIDLRCEMIGGQLHLKEDRYPQEVIAADAARRDEPGTGGNYQRVWVAIMINHLVAGVDVVRSYAVALGDEINVDLLGVDERWVRPRVELGVVRKLTLC
jgi:hypothetical protein